MRFTQATLLALSSGALSGLLVAAAPVAAGAGKRGLVATAEVSSCGSNDGGLTVKPGKAGNCPVGWGRPHYDANICVEIEHSSPTSHRPSSTHKTTHKSTSTHKPLAHSTNKAVHHTSSHKSSSTHKSSHKSASTKCTKSEATFAPGSVKAVKTTSSRKSSTTTHRPSSTTHKTTSHSPKPTAKPCGQDQTYNTLLSACVDLGLGDVASLGGGLKLGNPLGSSKGPLATAGLALDLGDVASLGAGIKLGGPAAKSSSTSHRASSTTKADHSRATGTSSPGECSDEDALLHLCLKVGNLVAADASVAGKKGLVNADADVAGIPVKATVAGKDGKLVDANVGNGAVKASVGGKDSLVNAKVGDALSVNVGSGSSGAKKQGGAVECPKGQILHLGVCVEAHATILGINADAAANVAL